MDETGYLTFALTKGRLAEKTLALLEQTGITCEEMKEKGSRKLIFVNEALKLKFFLAKGPSCLFSMERSGPNSASRLSWLSSVAVLWSMA